MADACTRSPGPATGGEAEGVGAPADGVVGPSGREAESCPDRRSALLRLVGRTSARLLDPSSGLEAVVGEALWEASDLVGAKGLWLVRVDGAVTSMVFGPPGGGGEAPALPVAALKAARRAEAAVVEVDRSLWAFPLVREGVTVGALVLEGADGGTCLADALVDPLRMLADVLTSALARWAAVAEREARAPEQDGKWFRMAAENRDLRARYARRLARDEIVAESEGMREVLRLVGAVARSESPVLIQGETGTGKELLARRIHALSGRSGRPLVAVNCAALPPTLIEAELFGREKGAYTGALTRQAGRFEVADRSTLFLDEIGELPLDLQAKLLRVLEEGRFERVGSTRTLESDVRLVTATNRNLIEAVEAGEFRCDLYFRLSVFPIQVPPLRDRPEDIQPLVWRFVQTFEEVMGRRIDHIPPAAVEAILAHRWPGNARELRNAVERAMVLSEDRVLALEPPEGDRGRAAAVERTLEEVQRHHIQEALARTGWRVRGPGGAAEVLGLKPTTLESRMARLDVRRPKTSGAGAGRGRRRAS
jgi:formate hydrogenlyase transcriptional activator